jgi:hypothetical protein
MSRKVKCICKPTKKVYFFCAATCPGRRRPHCCYHVLEPRPEHKQAQELDAFEYKAGCEWHGIPKRAERAV